MKNTKRSNRDVVVSVSKKDYEQSLKEGVEPEYALKPGKHLFRRGGFRERHPGYDPKKVEIKIPISIKLDKEVIDFFKARATAPNAAPYQTQINAALREYMKGRTLEEAVDIDTLLKNEKLISALAERVRSALT